MDSVQLWTLAENLGSVESLITHPVTMTHADVEEAGAAGRHHRRSRAPVRRPPRRGKSHRRSAHRAGRPAGLRARSLPAPRRAACRNPSASHQRVLADGRPSIHAARRSASRRRPMASPMRCSCSSSAARSRAESADQPAASGPFRQRWMSSSDTPALRAICTCCAHSYSAWHSHAVRRIRSSRSRGGSVEVGPSTWAPICPSRFDASQWRAKVPMTL